MVKTNGIGIVQYSNETEFNNTETLPNEDRLLTVGSNNDTEDKASKKHYNRNILT